MTNSFQANHIISKNKRWSMDMKVVYKIARILTLAQLLAAFSLTILYIYRPI
jgi:hypothetical protein